MKPVNNPSDMPVAAHYAIIEFTSVTIPGDERSRTAPGHGYPEHSVEYCTYYYTSNRQEWEQEVGRRAQNPHGRFKAFHVDAVAVITPKVDVRIEI